MNSRGGDHINKVAEAIWDADNLVSVRHPDVAFSDVDAKWHTHYRRMAEAAVAALGVRQEQYRSVNCPDDRDYDMVRWVSSWVPEEQP